MRTIIVRDPAPRGKHAAYDGRRGAPLRCNRKRSRGGGAHKDEDLDCSNSSLEGRDYDRRGRDLDDDLL